MGENGLQALLLSQRGIFRGALKYKKVKDNTYEDLRQNETISATRHGLSRTATGQTTVHRPRYARHAPPLIRGDTPGATGFVRIPVATKNLIRDRRLCQFGPARIAWWSVNARQHAHGCRPRADSFPISAGGATHRAAASGRSHAPRRARSTSE